VGALIATKGEATAGIETIAAADRYIYRKRSAEAAVSNGERSDSSTAGRESTTTLQANYHMPLKFRTSLSLL
jgi:hypothetical protein